MAPSTPASIDELRRLLAEQLYIADDGLATSIYLALKLRRPLLLEGEAGVGKTEVAKVLSAALGADLIRLQCYEGLDVNHAVYEWNYARQLIEIRLAEADGAPTGDRRARAGELFGPDFLIERPLLQALRDGRARPPVLLIDELDRADEEFEGYLLELLSDFQITIPELGTIKASAPPVVVITSNRTRELHDALKRRCVYAWIDYPSFEKELRIVTTKVPEAPAALAEQVTGFVQELRRAELYKVTGVSETLDWVAALVALDKQELDAATIERTLGIVLKTREDMQSMRSERIQEMLNRAKTPGPAAARQPDVRPPAGSASHFVRRRRVSGCSGGRQQQIDLAQHRGDGLPRQRPDHRRVPPAPVQALHLVREDDAGDTEPIRDGYLEGISLDLTGDRAQQRKADLTVVRGRRQHDGGPASGLLPAGLRVEVNPDRIPAIGNPPRRRHHASPPTEGPVSTSPWRLSSVTRARRSSSSAGDRFSTETTSCSPRGVNSTAAFTVMPMLAATDCGILSARLLPHLPIRVSMAAPTRTRRRIAM